MTDYAARHRERVASFDGTTCTACGQPMERNQGKAPNATPENPLHWTCMPGFGDPKPWASSGALNRRRENIDYGAERLAETAEARAAGWEQ